MSDPKTSIELAGRLAATGLPSASGGPQIRIPGEMWPRVARILEFQRLTGLAIAACEEGQLELSPEQTAHLVDRHREFMLHALTLDRRLLTVADALEEAGITTVVVKGPAVAYTQYPDPSWRPYGDLDLLVRTAEHAPACAALEALGFIRTLPDPRPGFTERFGYTVVMKDGTGLEIDLHRSLFGGGFGLWMQPDVLFEHLDEFEVGGRKLLRLDDTGLLLHACVHASLGFRPPLLLPLRDVMQMATKEGIDWRRLASWAARWKLRAVLRHAFYASQARLCVPLPGEAQALVNSNVASRAEQRMLAAYTGNRRSFGGIEMTTIRAVPGVASKATYVAAVLFPSREFMQARVGSSGWPAYRRRWRIPFRWLTAQAKRWLH